MSDKTKLYLCDGLRSECRNNGDNFCFRNGGLCCHTTDKSHRLKVFADGVQLNTEFTEDSVGQLWEHVDMPPFKPVQDA